MKARHRAVVLLWLAAGSVWISGCGNKFFDPAGQVGRYRATPAVNIILHSLGVAEEPPMAGEEGEEPRPEDTVAEASDFSLGPGDVLSVGIFELYNNGQWITDNYVVSETGNLSLPEAGVINVLGMTELDLERAIKQTLSPSILRDQPVRVTLLSSQRRTCSVLGEGVVSNGRQEIPRYDYRLADALAAAGGPRQYNVSYVYVSRKHTPASAKPRMRVPEETLDPPPLQPLDTLGPGMQEITPEPTASNSEYLQRRFNQPINQERRMLGMATPSMERLWASSEKVLGHGAAGAWRLGQQPVVMGSEFDGRAQGEPETLSPVTTAPSPFGPSPDNSQAQSNEAAGAEIEWVFEDGRWKPVSRTPGRPVETHEEPAPAEPQRPVRPDTTTAQPGQVDWVFENGKWLAVPVGGGPATVQPPRDLAQDKGVVPLDRSMSAADQSWEDATQSRLIKIPIDALRTRPDRYNIVIKAGDTIHVPVDILGEFYIDGNVSKRGAIPITGRYMTLKQAIAAAGGLGPLAYPKKCEVTRRLPGDREEIVLVDLDKIFSGELPDFYIKENDTIRVGTHYSSRWRAVLRNAFRAAYGFGFVYDRNFADADYGSGWPSWL